LEAALVTYGESTQIGAAVLPGSAPAMKVILFVGFLGVATVSGHQSEVEASSSSELANEAADLPFNGRNLTTYTTVSAVGLVLAMLILMRLGQRIGTRHLTPDITEGRRGLAPVDGVVFSLLGLLVAFTFHGAAERFDARRKLVIQEAGSIGTAWLRLDLLAEKDRLPLQALFRQYLDTRLDAFEKRPKATLLQLQNEIWQRAVAACNEMSPATTHLLPALNQMFDAAHTRVAMARIHPPKVIFATLIVLTFISALLVGHGMAGRKSRSWIHIFGFVITMAATICLILDLEYPRLGLIRIDAMDQVLVELRQTMN
jgi:hypothetical protein